MLFAFSLIIISFVIQVIWWRLTIPKKQTLIIIIIFLTSFVIFFEPLYNLFYLKNLDERQTTIFIQVFLFYFLFLASYLIAYTALEKDSPTVKIILKIYKNKNGILLKNILPFIDNKTFIKERLDDLISVKFIYLKKNKYFITNKGKFSLKCSFITQTIINQKEKST